MTTYPSTIDPAVRAHIESFYKAADDKQGAQSWGNHFAPGGIAKKSPAEVKGPEKLAEWIASSWAGVESREHIVLRVFPFENGKQEVMLHGCTKAKLTDGGSRELIWTGRLKFVESEEGVLIKRYTVIPDTTPATEEMLAA